MSVNANAAEEIAAKTVLIFMPAIPLMVVNGADYTKIDFPFQHKNKSLSEISDCTRPEWALRRIPNGVTIVR